MKQQLDFAVPTDVLLVLDISRRPAVGDMYGYRSTPRYCLVKTSYRQCGLTIETLLISLFISTRTYVAHTNRKRTLDHLRLIFVPNLFKFRNTFEMQLQVCITCIECGLVLRSLVSSIKGNSNSNNMCALCFGQNLIKNHVKAL